MTDLNTLVKSRRRWQITVGILILILGVIFVLFVNLFLEVGNLRLTVSLLKTPPPINRPSSLDANEFARSIVADAIVSEDAERNGNICWFGLTNALAASVLPACRRAVELEPENGVFQDNLALAMLFQGDRDAAIAGFNLYLDWLRENDLYAAYGQEREEWIRRLSAEDYPPLCELPQLDFRNPMGTIWGTFPCIQPYR